VLYITDVFSLLGGIVLPVNKKTNKKTQKHKQNDYNE